jgi:L-asparaginase II
VGLLKWMRAHCPRCPCDFEACLELAEEGGAVRAYLQMALDLLRMCNIEDRSATETADAVGLIDQGADLHAKTNDGYTPLHLACQNGHAEVVKALLKKGADLQTKKSFGWTPLQNACENGHVEVVKALLEKGADLHAKTNDGNTPLHYACQNGHGEMIMALLEKGADLYAKNDGGVTLLLSS